MGEDALPRLQRAPDRPFGRNLAADVPLREADDCPAAEERAIGLEDPAVRGLGTGERDHLLDEPVDDGLEPEVAREDLRGLDQRLLAPQALLVLAEEPSRVNREAELSGDRLGKRDLAGEPARRLGLGAGRRRR